MALIASICVPATMTKSIIANCDEVDDTAIIYHFHYFLDHVLL